MKRFVLVASFAAFFFPAVFSCGVKGPPQPPPIPAPGPPEDFQARVRENCVELSWQPPRSDSPDLLVASRFEVLRAREAGPGQEPAFMVIDRLSSTRFRDCSLSLEARAVYKVRGISAEGRVGREAGPVRVLNQDLPLAPTDLRSVAGDGYIEVYWNIPPDMPMDAGYNVYRAMESALFPWRPVNSVPIRGNKYVDGPLENGVRYFYEVRAVLDSGDYLPVEGPGGGISSAVPTDRYPPSAPQGFTAVWTEQGVALSWLRNQEPDLAGYMVWRRKKGVDDFKELFLDPILDNHYLDNTARFGMEYEYAITARDDAVPPNESPRSEIEAVYAEPSLPALQPHPGPAPEQAPAPAPPPP